MPTTTTAIHGTFLRRTKCAHTTAHTAMPMNQYQALTEEKNTAIRMMASKSSTVAKVIRNARIEPGSALANSASTANENAISVAVGTAQPWDISANGMLLPVVVRINEPGSPGPNCENSAVVARNRMGGVIMPPTAHSIGTAAALGLASEPVVSSCFSSRPTVRKKIVSKPS